MYTVVLLDFFSVAEVDVVLGLVVPLVPIAVGILGPVVVVVVLVVVVVVVVEVVVVVVVVIIRRRSSS